MKQLDRLKQLRKDSLRVSNQGKDGNLQSCFSSLEILWTLYNDILCLTPETLKLPEHDRFVLSKGQSNLALMAVLAEKGFIPRKELSTFCQFDSRVSMQADRTKFEGFIETSAGSLGHGFPMAVGMAWAAKIKGSPERIFVLTGDGELNEGTIWEAAIFASSENLKNLVLIIDDNHSVDRMLCVGSWEEKFKAFGFSVTNVDGHNCIELIKELQKKADSPKAIIAKTQRGYGSRTLMNDPSWFHRWPTDEELQILLTEVDEF